MQGTFNAETFKKIFLFHLIILGVTWGVLVFSGFGLSVVFEETIPHSRLAIGKIVSGATAIGFVAIGSLPIGIVSSGILPIGVFAFGATEIGRAHV